MTTEERNEVLQETIDNETKHMEQMKDEHDWQNYRTKRIAKNMDDVESSFDTINDRISAAAQNHQSTMRNMDKEEISRIQLENMNHCHEVKNRKELVNKEIETHRNAESLAEQKTIEQQTKEKERTEALTRARLAEGTKAVTMAREETKLAREIGDEKSKERREFLSNLEKQQVNDLTEMNQVFIENANREKDNSIAHTNELQALKLLEKHTETQLKTEQIRMDSTRKAYETYSDANRHLNDLSDDFSKANGTVNNAVKMKNPIYLRRSLGSVIRSLESMRTNKNLLGLAISRLAECRIDKHQDTRKALLSKLRATLAQLDDCNSSLFETIIDGDFLTNIVPIMSTAQMAIKTAKATWENVPPIDTTNTLFDMLVTNTGEMMRNAQLAVEDTADNVSEDQ